MSGALFFLVFTAAFAAGGASVYFATSKRFRLRRAKHSRSSIITNAMEYRLSMGPRIVAIGGGTGLSTLLGGLKGFTRNITAVVAVTDEGGSSGRLRQEWGMLPPGDIRNCIVALAENDSSLNSLLNFRFDRGELKGHSLGNLILLATTEMMGDFQRAVEELNKMLAIRGQVLPVTTENVVLKGETKDGERLTGELEISDHGRELAKLWIEPSDAEPLDAVKRALSEAEVIVLGPGSLFTSVMPNLLLTEMAALLRDVKVPIIYIANLMTQPKETEGMNIVAHVDWIASILGAVPDYILANQSAIPEEFVTRYASIGAEPLYLSAKEEEYLESLGSEIIYGDYCEIKNGKYLRHNAKHLSETIMEIVRGNRKN
ncbi:gluconeogenesis factor YvcK family protein [uncultured Cloacibacillus sp.]|uniref:gluconeogenesis factor YvcK family protein n=2 Tax=uncultured Cloacibacillus sp. TaxID=889794 RepID=UPI00261EB657|nr:gluconeogenesis factor YvcK family protein [uncultured Cloacibacillus sp.]